VTLVVHVADVVLPVADADGRPADPVPGGAVAVEGDRILDVGIEAAVVAGVAAGAGRPRIRRWRGVLTPGLVNAHTHLQYTAMADLGAAPPPFSAWLVEMGRRRRRTTAAQWAESARTGAFLALRSGTTTLADVVTDDAALAPVARSGLGGISYVEVAATDVAGDRPLPDRIADRVAAAPAGRAVGLAPHSPATLDAATVRTVVDLARARGLRLHTHLAESLDELTLVADGSGPMADALVRAGLPTNLVGSGAGTTPTRYAADLGLLGSDAHVAHGVHVDADDRALLRARGTAVAVCVRSNRVLGAGRVPLAAYLDEGSPWALGTDSLASSPSLDLWEEAAAAAELARHQGYDAADLPRRVVEAATAGGAAALGLAGRAGALVPGARADLAVFDVPGDGDPHAALIQHGGGSCIATVLGGRLVHRR
jgi:cytosine/adenosine deaminase-related metal-dependent hydrolase